jgi:protein SCO1/2
MRTTNRRARNALPLLIIGSVMVVLLGLVVLRHGTEPAQIGTSLGGSAAPDFTLTDYRGQTVSLSDFRGKVIVLTFIYTNCPDVCPAIARNLRAAYEQLPKDKRDDVALVAVTIDPSRDTSAALLAFSEHHDLAGIANWYALRGDPATLEQVWRVYGIYPGMESATPVLEHHSGSSPQASVLGGGMGHTDAIYLIDPEGRERVLMRSSTDPASLAQNIEALVR